MKKLVILTATRAEYGLLAPVIKLLSKEKEIDVRVVVTGAHLSAEFGNTINEIIEDGVTIDKKIEVLLSSDTPVAISKTMALAVMGFADYFDECKPDALMVLGDRYETLAVCMAALNARIPIMHLHGGEATEGAIDEAVRNSITKLSYLHFTSTEEYRNRVIQMGEEPTRVYNVGSIGVENALSVKRMTREELESSLGCTLGEKNALFTFHPVTLENNTAETQIREIIEVMQLFPEVTFICTKANADANGRIINSLLGEAARENENIFLFDSLGMKRYLSMLSVVDFAMGNSSSGIIEVPSFAIPTINIGDRQKGRIQAKSIINCVPQKDSLIQAINKALAREFVDSIKDVKNPYEKEKSAETIAAVAREYMLRDKLSVQKKFFDINI